MWPFVVGAALLLHAASARAEANDLVARPLVLEPGELEARLVLERNITLRSMGAPTSLAPDVWFGLDSRWTIGLVHSNQALGLVATGASICLKQEDYGCDRTYRGGGIEARWRWRTGALAVAPRGRLLARDVDPWKPALALGALVRWTRGRFAIASDPYLRVGLGNRDLGNRDALVIPIWFAIQPTCHWSIALHTGIDGELATALDGWHGPFALATAVALPRAIEVGAELGFPSLLGPQNSFKERAFHVWVSWRGRVR